MKERAFSRERGLAGGNVKREELQMLEGIGLLGPIDAAAEVRLLSAWWCAEIIGLPKEARISAHAFKPVTEMERETGSSLYWASHMQRRLGPTHVALENSMCLTEE